MESKFLTSRYPIHKLGSLVDTPHELLQTLSKDFDMFRVLRTSSFYNAATYAFLEHICRPFLSDLEFYQKVKKFKRNLRNKISVAREQRHYGKNPFTKLEQLVTKQEVTEIGILNFTVCVHTSENGQLKTEIFNTFQQDKSLLINVISIGNLQILLYSELMTFIDGFDPTTGLAKVKNVPSGLLKDVEKEFYCKEYVKPVPADSTIVTSTTPPVSDDLVLVFPSDSFQKNIICPDLDDEHPDAIENQLVKVQNNCINKNCPLL